MLQRPQLIKQLEAKQASIRRFERAATDAAESCAQVLSLLTVEQAERLRVRMTEDKAAFGAAPSDEFDKCQCFVQSFGKAWTNHAEARRWAVEVLENRTTFAADGSQLLPGRDISLPLACVQIAEFENPHNRHTEYHKVINLELLTPEDFTSVDDERTTPEILISLKRFELEVASIKKFLHRQSAWRDKGARLPLAFFDGTLVASFTRPRTEVRERYVAAVTGLLDVSEQTGVPVVGYVDQSYARDLAGMVEHLKLQTPNAQTLFALPEAKIFDAQILRAPHSSPRARLERFGDRSIFCYCLRQNLSEEFKDDKLRPRIGFCYLQTTRAQTPARLDIPAWVHDKTDMIEEVANIVRAECVVGNGYPYAIETADAAAVLTAPDRAQFFQIVQDYAAQHDFGFQVSSKATSKSHRR